MVDFRRQWAILRATDTRTSRRVGDWGSSMVSAQSRRSLLTAFGAAAIGISLASCGRQQAGTKAAGAEEPKLNFYNWDTYTGKTTDRKSTRLNSSH